MTVNILVLPCMTLRIYKKFILKSLQAGALTIFSGRRQEKVSIRFMTLVSLVLNSIY